MFTGTRQLDGAVTSVVVASVERRAILRRRRHAARRRRLVLHLRDGLGISVIACFSLTLFAVTLFSLVGR